MIPLLGALASLGSTIIGGLTSLGANKAQQKAAETASGVQRQNFLDTKKLLQPAIGAGNTARDYQLGLLGLPGGETNENALSAFRTSPGYEFAFDTGRNAVQGSAAAGGTLFSGKTLKDLTRFGQNLADTTFGDYYNRLGGLSGAGLGAAGNLATAGGNTANVLSKLAMGAGDARASSYMGVGNALSGGLNNLSYLSAYYNPPKPKPVFMGV